MAACAECKSFFPVPENADDFAEGKGDCVREIKDEKGKYWLLQWKTWYVRFSLRKV